MAQDRTTKPDENQGEGNRDAARNYNRETEEFIKSGKVKRAADDALKAVEGDEAEELEEAEEEGKSHAKGKDI